MGAALVGRFVHVQRETVGTHVGDAHDRRVAAVVGERLGKDDQVGVGMAEGDLLRAVGERAAISFESALIYC